jgi:2-isopropylmalate synthase
VAIFGKSWDLHATEILNVSLEENLEMIRDTVSFLKMHDREVVYDAEHFFDGYKRNPEYTVKTLMAAVEGGADFLVLCDTNGGTLTEDVQSIMEAVVPQFSVPFGIHVLTTAVWQWQIRSWRFAAVRQWSRGR